MEGPGDGGDHVYTVMQEVAMETDSGTVMLPQQDQGTTVYLDSSNLKEDVIISHSGEEEVVYIVQSKVVEMPDGTYAIMEDDGETVVEADVNEQGAAYQVLSEIPQEIITGSTLSAPQTTVYIQEHVEAAVAGTSLVTTAGGFVSVADSAPMSSVALTAAISDVDDQIQEVDAETEESDVKFVLCCQYCGTCFEVFDDLRVHLLEEHNHVETDENELDDAEDELVSEVVTAFQTCKFCQETYLDEDDLTAHMKQCIGSSEASDLDQSEAGGDNSVRIQSHTLIHKCQMCDMSFTVRSELDKHIEDGIHTFKEDPVEQVEKLMYVKCPYCERLFLEKWLKKSLHRHIKLEHQGQPADVPIQRVEMENKSRLQALNNDSKQVSFPCGLCDKIFIWKKSLLRHVKTFHDEFQYMSSVEIAETFGLYWGKRKRRYSQQQLECLFCDSIFLTARDRANHIADFHPNEDFVGTTKPLFKCPFCSLISKYKYCIRKHISLKHPGSYTEEEMADIEFPTVDPELYASFVKVLDKRPYEEKYKESLFLYQCPLCEYVSTNVSNMYRHVRSKRHEDVYTDDLLKDIEKMKKDRKDIEKLVKSVSTACQTTEPGWTEANIPEVDKMDRLDSWRSVVANREQDDSCEIGSQMTSVTYVDGKQSDTQHEVKDNDGSIICNESDELVKPVVKECVACQKSFRNMQQIVEHSKSHVNIKLTYKCSACVEVFTRMESFVEHKSSKHDETLQGSSFKYLQMTMVPLNKKPVTTFDCPYCEMVVSQDRVLQQHIMQAHSSIVNKTYIKQESLDITTTVHSVIAGFPCLYCLCVYSSVANIVKHMSLVHSDTDRGQTTANGGSVRKSSRKRKARDFGEDFESEVTPVKSSRSVDDCDEGRSLSPLMLLPTPTRKRRKKVSNAGDSNTLIADENETSKRGNDVDESADMTGVNVESVSQVVDVPEVSQMDTDETGEGEKQASKISQAVKSVGRKRKMAGRKSYVKTAINTEVKEDSKHDTEDKSATPVESKAGKGRGKRKSKIEVPVVVDVDTVNKCPHCDFTCKRSSALTFHINFNHANIKKEIIDPEYNDAQKLEGTQDESSEIAKVTGEFDDSVEDDADIEYVPDDAEADREDKDYECPFCDQCSFTNAGMIEKHARKMHPQEMSSLSSMVQKRKLQSGPKEGKIVLVCFYCKKEFVSKYEIEKHIIEKHKHMLMNTVRTHKVGKMGSISIQQERQCFKCPLCESLFTSEVGVTWHMNLRHPEHDLEQEGEIQAVTGTPGAKYVSLYSCPFCEASHNKGRKTVLRHVKACHTDRLDTFSIDHIPCELIETKKQNSDPIEAMFGDVVKGLDESVRIEEITGETDASELFEELSDKKLPGSGVENRFLCPYCEFTSTWKKSIVKHVKGLHPEMVDSFHGDLIACETMAKKTKVPETGYFTCPYCNVINKWKKSLIRHLRQNHPDLPQVVNFSYHTEEDQNQAALPDSFKSKIKKVLDCLLCGFSCRSKGAMVSHFQQVHGEVGEPADTQYKVTYQVPNERKGDNCHQCPKCDALYLWKKSIHLHMKTHHPEDQEIYSLLDRLVDAVHTQGSARRLFQDHKCSQCGLVLSSSKSLRSHLRLQHSSPRIRLVGKITGRKCVQCHLYFPTYVALLRHRVLSHNASAVHCSHCGRRFKTERECHIHEKVRHNPSLNHCPYPGCGIRCRLKMMLARHLKTHQSESESLHKCEVCGSMFQDKDDLKHHLLSIHASCDLRSLRRGRERVYRCDRCKLTFPSLHKRDQHMSATHTDRTVMCELCAAQFPSDRLLNLHMKTHDTTGKLKQVPCPDCGKMLFSKNMKKHMYFRHPHTMSCDCSICNSPYDGKHSIACRTCSKQFCSKIMLFGHNRIHHGRSGPLYTSRASSQADAKHRCLFCPCMFRTQRDRNIHMHESHKRERQQASRAQYTVPSVTDQLVATDCGDPDNTHVIHVGQSQGKQYLPKLSDTSFSAVIKELVYVMPKNSVLPYKCLLCGRCFAKSKYIRLHIRRAHVKDEDQPYRCKVCGSGFVRLTEFRKHSRAHSGFRPYKCHKCSKAFKQQANLMEHMYVHEEVKSFKCCICSRDFKQRGALNAHVNCHDTLKPFKCMFCKKGFTTRGELSRHMQRYEPEETRAGEKNFLCHICEQTFNHYPLLIKHIEEHNPEKPFHCSACSLSYGSYMSLYSHKLKNGHFLESEIETDNAEWNGKRGRRANRASNKEDVEKAVSSLESGDTQMYVQEMTVGDNILISEQDGSYILDETMPKSVEVVVDGLGSAEMLYVTEEDTAKSENEELLSIAKQLTELSSYTEVDTSVVHEDNQTAETAQMLKAEDEIIKDMLDADAGLLANMERHSAGRKWLYEAEAEKTPLLRETLLKYTPTSVLTQTIETDTITEVVEAAASIDNVVNEEHAHVDTVSEQMPSNMEELAAMIPSLVQNDSVTAYQSEDGTMIFLCVSDQAVEETVQSESHTEVVEVSDTIHGHELTYDTETDNTSAVVPTGDVEHELHYDGESANTSTFVSTADVTVLTETVIEDGNTGDMEVANTSSNVENVEVHEQVEYPEAVEATEEQIISVAALEADTVKVYNNETVPLAEQINVEIIEQKAAEDKHEIYQRSVVEYENDEQTFIQEEVLDENFAKSLNECNIYTYQGQDFRYTYLEDQKRFQCLECNFLVTSAKYLKLHMARHLSMQNRRCPCQYCPKRFVTNSELRRHMTTHTNERNFKCHLCPKAFRQVGHLNDHVKTHTREKLFKCSGCDAEFVTKSNMEIHWKRNHDTNRETFTCEHCGTEFMNKDGLKKHIGIQHSSLFEEGTTRRSQEPTGTKCVCEICGLTFRAQKFLSRHMRNHGKFTVVCEVCGAGFMRQETLKDHMAKVHSKEKPHMCEFCGQAFSVVQQLNAHRLKHNKVAQNRTPKQKKWECKVCGKRFGAKSSLAYHGGVSEACRNGVLMEADVAAKESAQALLEQV